MLFGLQRLNRLIAVAVLFAAAGCTGLRHGHAPFTEVAYERSATEVARDSLARAKSLEARGDERCVDEYFAACAWAWRALAEEAGQVGRCECYNTSLSSLLASACRFGRWNPGRQLLVRTENGGALTVPLCYHGFAWQAGDFQRLERPTHHKQSLLTRYYASPGAGLPLVVERSSDRSNPLEARFFPEKMFWSATAVLEFAPVANDLAAAAPAVLHLYNPLELQHAADAAGMMPPASDLTAPLARVLEAAPRTYFAGFIEPGGAVTPRLSFLEPYQPGKAPLVLIHGLFSDPQSWADMINDLRAAPGFAQSHQIWVFRYPTGQGFLQSASVLRRELMAAVQLIDPEQRDPALQNITLVGHSMGGLIAKLQVTYSDELVWSRLANRPLDEIVTTPETRAFLAQACYFEPLESVCRVVFIASPHCGSLKSSEWVGQGAAHFVEPSPEQEQMLAQLLADNPGTFNPLVERRFPTSIDMLAPNSPLLAAMRQMRFKAGVQLHNIVGVSHPISLAGPSDGVVSVASATHPNCHSVLAVNAPHAKVHRALDSSREILRILGCR